MKIIILSLAQLKNLFKKNRLVFCLFFGGILLSVLAFIYSYGNIAPSKVQETLNDPAFRTIAVHLPSGLPIQEEFLYQLDEYGIEEVSVDHYDGKYELFVSENGLLIQAFRENGVTVLEEFRFEQKDFMQDVVIVSNAHEGETMDLEGKEYRILKKVSFMSPGYAFIPIQAFLSQQLEIDTIQYTFKDYRNRRELMEISEKLHTLFPQGEIVPPRTLLEDMGGEDTQALFLIGAVFFIAMMVFLILFNQLVRANAPDYVLYRITGASRFQVFLSILIQNMIFFLTAFLLAFLIHRGLYGLFDQWLNFRGGIRYTMRDYGSVFVLACLGTVLMEMPFALGFANKTLIGMKTKYNP